MKTARYQTLTRLKYVNVLFNNITGNTSLLSMTPKTRVTVIPREFFDLRLRHRTDEK